MFGANLKMQCRMCRLKSSLNGLEMTLRNIERELDVLSNQIPRDYRVNFERLSSFPYKQSLRGLCGRCLENYDTQYSIKENRMLENLRKILSYEKEFPNTFNLSKLKQSFRGDYASVYRLIERIEHEIKSNNQE